MIEFFSLQHHKKEQVAGRALLTAVALFFLLTAIVRSLPSKEAWAKHLESSGLSGYHKAEDTTAPSLSESDLEEFYDYPISEPNSTPSAIAAHLANSCITF